MVPYTAIGESPLDSLTIPGELYLPEDGGKVRCTACAHRCLIQPGKRGVCQVRFNLEGQLRAPGGYVAALQIDPVEKKPFNHLIPGGKALTFGMLGCDFHCGYCQNWLTSQTLRDPQAEEGLQWVRAVSPARIIELARAEKAQLIVSSYNEPLITSEWAARIFREARQAGLLCAFVSNGHATPEALAYLRPWLDAYKVDLKSMRDASYRQLGGALQPVLDTIQNAHQLGLWVEVVTLVTPGFNDSIEELWEAARFLASISSDIPWHLTAYHPDYRMTDHRRAVAADLRRAAEIGQEAGLRYVYAGNLPGQVGEYENTLCPKCQSVLVKRIGFRVIENALSANGRCPHCGENIPGVWKPTNAA